MKTINIDDDVHEQVAKIVKDNPFDYPTIQFYVNAAVKEKLKIDTIRSKEAE
jgi:Arc/MetJ family transcription regulator